MGISRFVQFTAAIVLAVAAAPVAGAAYLPSFSALHVCGDSLY